MPLPYPAYEIFVYSPRMEGVHLRGGKVARGGIRWSDRREDFRTEVLGLMKAQMVKNGVIVPVGAKGGFVVKQPPRGGDRAALHAEVVACYQTLMRGMLDITDNRVGEEIVPPARVVRYDDDDPYLVVAADKGTATFSDIANAISLEYGHWLGDAFASGGSAGYDHKGMGITARGAWESVKRHFRELGKDCQTEPFTAIGIGDMSGDVFGNGVLQSRQMRLIAAFDHRHIFIDPDPDPASSYAERKRLFELPRSSWDDYDRSRISPGGGVYPRTVKSITLSPEARRALATDTDTFTPHDLIRTILLAPVELFWNGGIGTYVKAAQERNAEASDRSNDPVRVNGEDLRCLIVGEGGNLGFTQRGRIAFARKGGRINTDFDRQLGRRRLLRPRGQHQDPAGRGGRRRRHDRQAARSAARPDDRRGRPAWSCATTSCRRRRSRSPRRDRRRCWTARRRSSGASRRPAGSIARSRCCPTRRSWRSAASSATACSGPRSRCWSPMPR